METRMRIAWIAALALALPSATASAQERASESGLQFRLNPTKPPGPRSPVIIFLHGTGGGIQPWGAWEDEARKRGYIVVVPQSTGFGDEKAGNRSGDQLRRWAEVDLPKIVSLAREVHRTHNGDPKRTYIGGFSNGAFHAMEYGLRNPDVFSAVLCLGGGCNVHALSDSTKRMGAYIVHGTADNSVPYDAGKRAAEQLEKHGLDVVFKTKDGKGHETFPEEAKGFFDWVGKFQRTFTPGGLGWETDLDAALAKSKETGSLVWAWCWGAADAKSPAAEYFEMMLLVDEQVAAHDAVRVQIDRGDVDRAKSLGVTKPTLAILDGDGKVLKRFDKPLPREQLLASIKSLEKKRK